MISPIEIVFYLAGAISFFALSFALLRLVTPLLTLIEEARLLLPVLKSSAEKVSAVLSNFEGRKSDAEGSGGTLRALGSVVADALIRRR